MRVRVRAMAAVLPMLMLAASCGQAAKTAAPAKPATPSAPTKPAASSTSKSSAAPSSPTTTASQSTAKAPKPLKKVSLILDWIPRGYHAPFYMAKAEGLFAKQGLDVTITPGKGSGVAVEEVAAGKYMLGSADGGTLMQYVSKGTPVRMVFDTYRKSSQAIMVNAKLGFKSLKDLEGHAIAATPGGASALLLPAVLKNAGADPSKVKIVSAGSAERNGLLLSGKVDGIGSEVVSEDGTLLSKGMPTTWFLYADYGLNAPAWGIVATDKTIKNDPGMIRGFVKALTQGMKDTKAHPLKALEDEAAMLGHPSWFTIKAQSISLKDGIKFWNTKASQGHPLGWMPPQDWARAAKALEKYAKMKPINPTSAYTNAFIPKG